MAHREEDIWAEGGAPVNGITAEFGIPRTRQFELIADGTLQSVLMGRRRIVSRRSARDYLRGLHQEQAADRESA